MTPIQLLQKARADGVAFTIKDGILNIRADTQKREKWALILRPHKADLLALVAQEVAHESSHATAAGEYLQEAETSQTAMSKGADNAPAPVPPQVWRAVRNAYYDHHHRCPTCIAAGKGFGLRCGAGASLWAAYQGTPWPGYAAGEGRGHD